MKKYRFLMVVAMTLLMACLTSGCGGGGDKAKADSVGDDVTDATIDFIDNYVCDDERDQALYYSTDYGRHNTSIPALWDGTPFVIDVSSSIVNATQLLGLIADEAARINVAIGYEVIVAGDVLPMADRDVYEMIRMPNVFVSDQHASILCCAAPGKGGNAFASLRAILMDRHDVLNSTYAVTHELWHLFGFCHPDEVGCIAMSDRLMNGQRIWPNVVPTESTAVDLGKLACIFDDF